MKSRKQPNVKLEKRRGTRISPVDVVLYLTAAIYTIYQFVVPNILGLSSSEKARWGPIESTSQILSSWSMRVNNIGRISWRDHDSDEWHVVITQDGKVIATSDPHGGFPDFFESTDAEK